MGVEFKKRKIPYFPFVWFAFRYMEFRIGVKFDTMAPANNIAKSDAKFFLIHGMDDKTAPIEHADELYEKSNHKNTTLWKIEGKGHSDCNHHPKFWQKVIVFYKSSL
jgi:dipeptidyl aminopeptidase/acylaminoacyl peptidase